MNYNECKVLCEIKKSKDPIISKVPIDEFTKMVELNFDYEFTGESKFYPYVLPKEITELDFGILVICGASGKGKSTLLKAFDSTKYHYAQNTYDASKAVVSNFTTPNEAAEKLSSVGLNSLPVWTRSRSVLSVGEGFRADTAKNLESYTIFDEFTSTIDRNVAKSTCNGLQKYIRNKNLNHMVFCSCHKDYIAYLQPDYVIDLDDEKVYDCRGACLGKTLPSESQSARVTSKDSGGNSKNITISLQI